MVVQHGDVDADNSGKGAAQTTTHMIIHAIGKVSIEFQRSTLVDMRKWLSRPSYVPSRIMIVF